MQSFNKFSKFCIGTANFGRNYGIVDKKKITFNEIKNILNYAYRFGINTIDTAISYGKSEVVLGKLNTKNFNIITKLPKVPSNCVNLEKWVFDKTATSIKKLKVKKLYAILIHEEHDLINHNSKSLYKALKKLKEEKIVNNIGVSIYNFKNIDKIIKKFKIDIVQVPFSLIDRRLLTLGYLKKLKKNKIKIFVRSIFLQGLLLVNKSERNNIFKYGKNFFLKLDKWIKKNSFSSLKICLDYVLKFPEINKIIIGVNSLSQLKEIKKSCQMKKIKNFPKINSKDLRLINPKNW